MKILMYGFPNDAVKENVKSYLEWNWYAGEYDAKLRVKAITSRNGNLKGFEVYRIGSQSKIYEVDGVNMKAYCIHRGKRTEEYDILTVKNQSLFEYWKSL